MNEAQTKNDLIELALPEAGWGIMEGSRLRLEPPLLKVVSLVRTLVCRLRIEIQKQTNRYY